MNPGADALTPNRRLVSDGRGVNGSRNYSRHGSSRGEQLSPSCTSLPAYWTTRLHRRNQWCPRIQATSLISRYRFEGPRDLLSHPDEPRARGARVTTNDHPRLGGGGRRRSAP